MCTCTSAMISSLLLDQKWGTRMMPRHFKAECDLKNNIGIVDKKIIKLDIMYVEPCTKLHVLSLSVVCFSALVLHFSLLFFRYLCAVQWRHMVRGKKLRGVVFFEVTFFPHTQLVKKKKKCNNIFGALLSSSGKCRSATSPPPHTHVYTHTPTSKTFPRFSS